MKFVSVLNMPPLFNQDKVPLLLYKLKTGEMSLAMLNFKDNSDLIFHQG